MFGIVAGAAVACLVAGVRAFRNDTLSLYDLGAVVLAPIVFFVVAGVRDTAWAMIIWPLVAWTLLMCAYSVKVFVLDRRTKDAKGNSRRLFFGALAVCLVAGLTVPPWYD